MTRSFRGGLGRWTRRPIDCRGIARTAARFRRMAHAAPVDELLATLASLDLAALSEQETPETVRAVCARGARPLALGRSVHVAAVCVLPAHVAVARTALRGTPVRVAVVAGGFPGGGWPLPAKVIQIREVVGAGAQEVDAVIARAAAWKGDWAALYDEVAAFKEACGAVPLKVILQTGALGSLERVARASRVAILAGADFIKTSTGREARNATLPVGLVMARAIRETLATVGRRVGLKPSGGIRTVDQALAWRALVREALGPEWLSPSLFRIGASALLAEFVVQIKKTGTE